ncbi:MAG TPA: MG2 domain-containing protein, partial [Gemmataceae bacterium]|nr:MG2 domain-containing protein [Gemmataceae bacterium]
MSGKWKTGVVGLGLVALAVVYLRAGEPTQAEQRSISTKAFKAGNYKDAYNGLRKLALDPKNDHLQVGGDMDLAINCLRNLGRVDEIDEFREAVIAVHIRNWRLLEAAAKSYSNDQHFGYIVAGKFYRGHHRGGGRFVASMLRDRARAFQLMEAALELTKKEEDKKALAQFHLTFAGMILNGGGGYEPWRLQYLTNVNKLPDYQEGGYNFGRRGFGFRSGGGRAAPVDEKGNPIYHHVPKSYKDSNSDGERWRWLLTQAMELNPSLANECDMIFANFLRGQFGVQTMAYYGRVFQDGDKDGDKNTGTFALHTLKDTETIARLATGIKRFSVPDGFNWIKIYQRVANRGRSDFGAQARDTIANIHEDRRQYVKAAADWNLAITEYGPGTNNYRQDKVEQILGNWGRFEPGKVQAAGNPATGDFRFRNGKKVSFEAFEIDVPKLLDDTKTYLKNNGGHIDWNKINIGNIGFRLVNLNEQQYIKGKVANWDVNLKPRPNHVDDRITVTTPLVKPGAYLVTAKMDKGNVSRIIVWVADTVIVKKQLEGKVFYFVADAVTGQPVPKANVEFFGWNQVQIKPGQNVYRVVTSNFAEQADKDGQVFIAKKQIPEHYQWLVIARSKDQQDVNRLAYMGFNGIWFGQIHDPEYNQTKVFAITDRPVYRPQQTVNFKLWVRHAKYDQADTSSFANQNFTVEIRNPKNEKLLEKTFTTDAYGGISGELALPKSATLGVYQIFIPQKGGGSFRVEEYKKPEFEVVVEAPKEPVQLGEKISATIKAKYYFGSPVTNAVVKYKVLRTSHSSTWHPPGAWDWLYGRGYWWFAPDYAWFPGWGDWGCMRPAPWWWHRPMEQPELVLENEVPIGPDGTVQVEIDTALAKAVHGNQDHKYTISAEVVDESRRTIDGTGDVLVSRKPFQVFAWVNRGYFRVGDTIAARFTALTLDRKPVQGTGELTLYQITYNKKNEPVEKAVQTWKLDTNVE